MCNLINYSGGAEKSFPSSTSFRQKATYVEELQLYWRAATGTKNRPEQSVCVTEFFPPLFFQPMTYTIVRSNVEAQSCHTIRSWLHGKLHLLSHFSDSIHFATYVCSWFHDLGCDHVIATWELCPFWILKYWKTAGSKQRTFFTELNAYFHFTISDLHFHNDVVFY